MVLKPGYLFEVYKKIDDGVFSPTPIIMNIFDDLALRRGIESVKDVLTAKYPNENVDTGSFTRFLGKKVKTDNIFNIDDEIKFYAYYNQLPSDKDQALLLTGRIAGFGYDPTSDKLTYNLKIINRTEELLNTMTPFSTRAATGSANTSPTAIKQMIARLNQFHGSDPRRVIVASLSTEINPITGSAGKIQNVRSDGSSFPRIDYNETWKPVQYNVEKLSAPDYTGDEGAGTYISYITYTPVQPSMQTIYGPTINEFVWKPKSQVTTGSLYEGRDLVNIKIKLDVKDIQNLLIVNAGTDRRGAGITGVAYNLESIGKFGAKAGYYTKSRRLFSNIWGQEINYVTGSLAKFIDPDGMPSTTAGSSAYPLNMSFKDRNDITGSITGSVLTANNKDQWNQYLRDESRWQAVLEAQKILEKLGTPRYTLGGDMIVGSNTIIPGNLYGFVIPSYGWDGTVTNPAYKLRITTISDNINKGQGWFTQIDAEEDEKVISEMLGNTKTNVG